MRRGLRRRKGCTLDQELAKNGMLGEQGLCGGSNVDKETNKDLTKNRTKT